MTSIIAAKENTQSVSQGRNQVINTGRIRCYPVYNDVRTGKLLDEVIGAVKDNRTNTKRAISADIASTARVQNQNERVIAICEKELRRQNLTDERREELLDRIRKAAESTACANEESREFQRRQLEHSHKLPWKIFGVIIGFMILGIGGAVICT